MRRFCHEITSLPNSPTKSWPHTTPPSLEAGGNGASLRREHVHPVSLETVGVERGRRGGRRSRRDCHGRHGFSRPQLPGQWRPPGPRTCRGCPSGPLGYEASPEAAEGAPARVEGLSQRVWSGFSAQLVGRLRGGPIELRPRYWDQSAAGKPMRGESPPPQRGSAVGSSPQ